MTGGRILHCIPGMGGGGAERQLALLADALPQFGWDVHVALRSEGPNFPRLQRTPAAIHRISGLSNHDPQILWQLHGLMRRLRPDLVQVWLVQMEVAAGLAATFNGIPWILSERSSDMAYPRTWKNRLRVGMAGRAAAIAANSPLGARYWASLRRAPPQVVIPNAIPRAEIARASTADPAELELSSSCRLIMFAGRFSAEKNVGIMMEALMKVLADMPDATALLAGDGPLLADAERVATDPRNRDRIRTPGYLDDGWRWMKRADVFVSVSRFEGHPNAVLEAAACGAPLVLSDIPAHRAMFDERSALFAQWDDAGSIAAAIQTTLGDADAARRRAESARAAVAGLDVASIASRYDDLYRQVLAARAANLPEKAAQ
jgi:glycosyltransferase involved in cell wall biosynthesis